MRLGLGARLAIAFALLAALTALVTAGVSSASTSRRIKGDVDQFLRERAVDISEGRRRPVRTPERGDDRSRDNDSDDNKNNNGDDDAEVEVEADSVRRAVEADALVQILDRNGVVVTVTSVRLPVSQTDISMADQRAPLQLRTEDVNGEPFRIATMHIEGGGAIQVARSLQTTNAVLGEIRTEVIFVGLAMSALSGLIGWAVASRTTRPLRRLTRSVQLVRDTQDLNQTVQLDRTDELGKLSQSFDQLLASLAASRTQQHRLVQDAAHELRTPLTSVRANIDFLERASDLDTETRGATLSSIRSELSELSDLLAEVVELATESQDRATFESLDLVTAAEAALAQFELRSPRPVEREMTSTMVNGDLSMLSRAIGNLVANADKYTPDDTAPIVVRVANGTVMVADRGLGIDPDDREKIFERFWRADEARSASGSGLGLAIVKKVVDEHGGSVFARARAGGGSEIGFELRANGQ